MQAKSWQSTFPACQPASRDHFNLKEYMKQRVQELRVGPPAAPCLSLYLVHGNKAQWIPLWCVPTWHITFESQAHYSGNLSRLPPFPKYRTGMFGVTPLSLCLEHTQCAVHTGSTERGHRKALRDKHSVLVMALCPETGLERGEELLRKPWRSHRWESSSSTTLVLLTLFLAASLCTGYA